MIRIHGAAATLLSVSLGLAFLPGCQSADSSNEPTQERATTTHWYMTSATDLRVEPTLDARIAHPQEARDTLNWKGVLYRGDSVQVIRDTGSWAEIRLSSGAHGWVESAFLLPGDDLPLATVTQNVKHFSKQGSSQAGDEPLSPGTLLIVLSQNETWSQVNIDKGVNRWVATSDLVFDEKELAVTRFVVEATWHTKHQESRYNARRLEKVLAKYPQSALLNRLAQEVPVQDLRNIGYESDPAVKALVPSR